MIMASRNITDDIKSVEAIIPAQNDHKWHRTGFPRNISATFIIGETRQRLHIVGDSTNITHSSLKGIKLWSNFVKLNPWPIIVNHFV